MNKKGSGFVIVVLFGLFRLNRGLHTADDKYQSGPTTPTATPATAQMTTMADGDWPGYNRTLTSDRFSSLNQITTENVANLKQVCAFNLGESGNFQSGIIVVNNTLYVTTDANTFAIDPATCQQKWKQTGITSMSWKTKAGNAKVVVYALP